jgi:hypothetical protein
MKRINIGENINSLLFVGQMQYSLLISTAANWVHWTLARVLVRLHERSNFGGDVMLCLLQLGWERKLPADDTLSISVIVGEKWYNQTFYGGCTTHKKLQEESWVLLEITYEILHRPCCCECRNYQIVYSGRNELRESCSSAWVHSVPVTACQHPKYFSWQVVVRSEIIIIIIIIIMGRVPQSV